MSAMISDREIQVISRHQDAASQLATEAASFEIDSEERAEEATAWIKSCQSRVRKMEDERKALVQPLNDHVKYINGRFKELTDPVNKAVTIVRRRLGEYLRAEKVRQEEERRKAEEEMLEAAAKAEAQGDSERAEAALTVATTVSTANVKAVSRASTGAVASTRKVYKVRVTSLDIYEMKRFLVIADVPSDHSLTSRSAPVPLVSLNMQEIHAAHAAGEKLPKGIEVITEDDLVVR